MHGCTEVYLAREGGARRRAIISAVAERQRVGVGLTLELSVGFCLAVRVGARVIVSVPYRGPRGSVSRPTPGPRCAGASRSSPPCWPRLGRPSTTSYGPSLDPTDVVDAEAVGDVHRDCSVR